MYHAWMQQPLMTMPILLLTLLVDKKTEFGYGPVILYYLLLAAAGVAYCLLIICRLVFQPFNHGAMRECYRL